MQIADSFVLVVILRNKHGRTGRGDAAEQRTAWKVQSGLRVAVDAGVALSFRFVHSRGWQITILVGISTRGIKHFRAI